LLNAIWTFMLAAGVLVAAVQGRVGAVTDALTASAQDSVQLIFSFIGILVFWTGLARVAEAAGLVDVLARALQPVLRPLFPSIPRGHPAFGSIVMNLAANVLGLGSAATPLGLKAMSELQSLNPDSRTATPAMCTFLAINTSSVTLVPTTMIALRAAAGSLDPAAIVGSTLAASAVATGMALTLDYLARRRVERGAGRRG